MGLQLDSRSLFDSIYRYLSKFERFLVSFRYQAGCFPLILILNIDIFLLSFAAVYFQIPREDTKRPQKSQFFCKTNGSVLCAILEIDDPKKGYKGTCRFISRRFEMLFVAFRSMKLLIDLFPGEWYRIYFPLYKYF